MSQVLCLLSQKIQNRLDLIIEFGVGNIFQLLAFGISLKVVKIHVSVRVGRIGSKTIQVLRLEFSLQRTVPRGHQR